MGLKGLDEAALFFGVEITLDCRRASERECFSWTGGGLDLLEVKDGTKRFNLGAEGREGGELDAGLRIDERDGTVGGAEVEADGGRLRFRDRPGGGRSRLGPATVPAPILRPKHLYIKCNKWPHRSQKYNIERLVCS